VKHRGHHGGAWKVAYADFVTAMMALFLVLWLTAQDEKIKEAIERAFRHPFSSLTEQSVGILPRDNEKPKSEKRGKLESQTAVELELLRRLNQDLLKSLQAEDEDPSLRTVEVEITPEGLLISIYDRSHRPVFKEQTAQFTPYGHWVFSTLAWEVSRHHTFSIEVEGHTEKGHSPPSEGYDNWDLSTDRANVARRKLLDHGVGLSQIVKVAGYADTRPVPKKPPEDEVNRRVTVMLRLPGDRA
jgi:chemotaxis protein MotB